MPVNPNQATDFAGDAAGADVFVRVIIGLARSVAWAIGRQVGERRVKCWVCWDEQRWAAVYGGGWGLGGCSWAVS